MVASHRRPRRRASLLARCFLAGLTIVAGCAETSPLLQGGPGSTESEAFSLSGGSYVLGWTVSPQTTDGCAFGLELLAVSTGVAVARGTTDATAGGAMPDARPVPDLAAGQYRLRVETTCEEWSAVVGKDPQPRR
jgi:hypothetical protein